MLGFYLLQYGFTHLHMQIDAKNTPDTFKLLRPVLKGPGAGKYGLGPWDRKISFMCCLTMSITNIYPADRGGHLQARSHP